MIDEDFVHGDDEEVEEEKVTVPLDTGNATTLGDRLLLLCDVLGGINRKDLDDRLEAMRQSRPLHIAYQAAHWTGALRLRPERSSVEKIRAAAKECVNNGVQDAGRALGKLAGALDVPHDRVFYSPMDAVRFIISGLSLGAPSVAALSVSEASACVVLADRLAAWLAASGIVSPPRLFYTINAVLPDTAVHAKDERFKLSFPGTDKVKRGDAMPSSLAKTDATRGAAAVMQGLCDEFPTDVDRTGSGPYTVMPVYEDEKEPEGRDARVLVSWGEQWTYYHVKMNATGQSYRVTEGLGAPVGKFISPAGTHASKKAAIKKIYAAWKSPLGAKLCIVFSKTQRSVANGELHPHSGQPQEERKESTALSQPGDDPFVHLQGAESDTVTAAAAFLQTKGVDVWNKTAPSGYPFLFALCDKSDEKAEFAAKFVRAAHVTHETRFKAWTTLLAAPYWGRDEKKQNGPTAPSGYGKALKDPWTLADGVFFDTEYKDCALPAVTPLVWFLVRNMDVSPNGVGRLISCLLKTEEPEHPRVSTVVYKTKEGANFALGDFLLVRVFRVLLETSDDAEKTKLSMRLLTLFFFFRLHFGIPVATTSATALSFAAAICERDVREKDPACIARARVAAQGYINQPDSMPGNPLGGINVTWPAEFDDKTKEIAALSVALAMDALCAWEGKATTAPGEMVKQGLTCIHRSMFK